MKPQFSRLSMKLSRATHSKAPVVLYTLLVLFAIGFVMLVTALITLRVQEQITVPDVVGDEIAFALLKLQERDLVPNVRLQYDADQATAGRVVDQTPAAGANVRVGKQVNLVISRGRALFAMESFVGQTIEEVNTTIQTIESNHEAIIQLGNVIYTNSNEPVGVVLEQNPLPDSEIGAFTQLDLVVSLGAQERNGIIVPDLRKAHFEGALETLLREQIPFRFVLGAEPSAENPYRISTQNPTAGTILTDQPLVLTVSMPVAVDLGFAFGIYEYPLAPAIIITRESPLVLRAVLPNNQERTLAIYTYLPLTVSIPYLLPVGSAIELVADQVVLDSRAVE